MKSKIKEIIDFNIAMDNISTVASMELDDHPPLGMIKKSRLVMSEEEMGLSSFLWQESEGPDAVLELLDATYQSIYQHLIHIYEDSETDWESEKLKKRIVSMMELVAESSLKMGAYLSERLQKNLKKSVSEIESFKTLQKFYTRKLLKKLSLEEEKEGEEEEDSSFLQLSKGGEGDFEIIKQDKEYELFYIRKEDGSPYFDHVSLRNVKLSCGFDLREEEFEEDPFLSIRAMRDRDVHATAGDILEKAYPAIVDFYRGFQKAEKNEFLDSMASAILALFLAANPRYLVQNTVGKSCLQYFEDFHLFLRTALQSTEYQKLIAYGPEASDQSSQTLFYLVHLLSLGLFERSGGIKLESVGLLHRAMRKGEETKKKKKEQILKGETVWNQLLLDDEKYRTFLFKFPNGPLFKVLDLIREEGGEEMSIPFDPIGQENLPLKLYQIESRGKKIQVLKIPSPTRQWLIHKAEVIEEFKAFLKGLTLDHPKGKHLLINLQDRSSWKEFARCKALEALQMNIEYNDRLVVITLPKYSDFYHQSNEYLNLNRADDFLKAFEEQVLSSEECGFFFPGALEKEIHRFTKDLLPLIHTHFFENKSSLTRRAREDFIELFYQFLILKCIDLMHPSSLSFTCKDAVDTGASQGALFYALIQLMNGQFLEKGKQELFRWLMYTPALFIRERGVDAERFHRTLSSLERFDGTWQEKEKKIIKDFSAFYSQDFFKNLNLD